MSFAPIHKDLYGELVDAACLMVHAHAASESMLPAIKRVAEEFPRLTHEQLMLLWFGVNAKDRGGRGRNE